MMLLPCRTLFKLLPHPHLPSLRVLPQKETKRKETKGDKGDSGLLVECMRLAAQPRKRQIGISDPPPCMNALDALAGSREPRAPPHA